AIPESQIRAFVQTLTGGQGGHDQAAELLAIADEAFAAGDVGTAAQAYGQVLQDEPGHPKAVAGLGKWYLKNGDTERAKATLQLVRPDGVNDEAVRAVEAELRLREQAAKAAGGLDTLKSKVESDPNDNQARFDLALAIDATGDRNGAIEELLRLV